MSQTARLKDRQVLSAELKAHAPSFNRYHFAKSQSRSTQPVLKGAILTQTGASGLVVHTTNAVALQDFEVETQIAPCVRIILFFEGENRFCFGEQNLTLGKDCQRARIVIATESTPCRMAIRKGDRRCGLYVCAELEWFAQQGLDSVPWRLPMQTPLAIHEWALPRHLWLHARSLLDLSEDSHVVRLEREAFGVALMAAWVASLEARASPESSAVESRQGQRFCQLLACEESWSLSLEQIGHQLGMSAATLQRYAQEHLGMSLTQYLRKQRLSQACQALHQEQVSIMEAALMAGYSHPNNFSAAFKRQFGVSPNEVCKYSLNSLLAKH